MSKVTSHETWDDLNIVDIDEVETKVKGRRQAFIEVLLFAHAR